VFTKKSIPHKIAPPKSEGELASEHKGILDVFDMERIDAGLGEDLKSKFETIAQNYRFRRPGSDGAADINAVEDICEHNSEVAA
jgi:hypothetical protein